MQKYTIKRRVWNQRSQTLRPKKYVFEHCSEQVIILSKSEPFQLCLRMVQTLCLSLDDGEQVAEKLDNALTNAYTNPLTNV